jgi:putative ABC transport system substrate-binding protein
MNRPIVVLRTLLLCVVLVTELVPAFSNGPVTIAVVLSREIAPYHDALRGFKEQIQGPDKKFRFVEFNLEISGQTTTELIERIRSKEPALVLSIGSAATSLIASEITDIPVVFSLVLPSRGSKSLEELRAAQRNVTGATMEIPLSTQFAKIREVLPSARKVGVLFDPEVSGPLVETAGEIAGAQGFDLVALPVSSENDVVRRMKELEGEVDVLWSVADSTVFTPQGLKHILLSTLRARIPFVGLSPSFVKAGALLALSCDYQDVGRQSAELAQRIIAGETPGEIRMVVPREVSMSLNLHTARQIQVAISRELELAAAQTF